MVRKLDIDGDAQVDLAGHGGEHRAVFVYQMDSYHYWERFLGRNDFTFGQFGENFTVEGLPDDEVCVGDRYRIGGAEFEVTQPRVTCFRVGIRMNEPRMAALLVAHHRPGFYIRVLQEGEVGAGDDIAKLADGPERITVAEVDALLYLPGHSSEQLQRALRIPGEPRSRERARMLFPAKRGCHSGYLRGNGRNRIMRSDIVLWRSAETYAVGLSLRMAPRSDEEDKQCGLTAGFILETIDRHLSVLADLDEVAVGITHVAAPFPAVGIRQRLRKKDRAFVAPLFVAGPDVGDTQIEEAVHSVDIRRCFKKDLWFVGSRATAAVENDPAISQLDVAGILWLD